MRDSATSRAVWRHGTGSSACWSAGGVLWQVLLCALPLLVSKRRQAYGSAALQASMRWPLKLQCMCAQASLQPSALAVVPQWFLGRAPQTTTASRWCGRASTAGRTSESCTRVTPATTQRRCVVPPERYSQTAQCQTLQPPGFQVCDNRSCGYFPPSLSASPTRLKFPSFSYLHYHFDFFAALVPGSPSHPAPHVMSTAGPGHPHVQGPRPLLALPPGRPRAVQARHPAVLPRRRGQAPPTQLQPRRATEALLVGDAPSIFAHLAATQ